MRKILLNIFLLIVLTQPVISQVNSGWYWVNPYPSGISLRDPQFFDLNTGYCIISNRLHLTTNAGLNWNRIDEQIGYTGAYQFVDINTGWLSSNNNLYHTTNGGTTLNLIASNLVSSLTDIAFLDQFGITIGNTSPPVGSSNGELKSTTNGGANWSFYYDSYLKDFSKVEILNDSFAVVLCETIFDSTTILRTQNKGANWEILKTPYRNEFNRDLVVIDEQKYIILGTNKLIITTNGGNSWFDVPLEPASNSLVCKFWNSNTGIVTNYTNYNFRTINGGTNWNINKTDINYYCNQLSIIPGGYGVISGRYGTLLKTSDYGQSWLTNASSLTFSDLRDVRKIDSNSLISIGFDGKIFKSTNQGINWEEQNSGTNSNLLASYFINSDIGFVCGHDGITLRTSNGGTNWNILPALTQQRLFDIEFINSTTGFISGNNGELLKSTNSGISWVHHLTLNASPQIFDINFVNENTGFLGCSQFKIFKTTNGGDNWDLKNTSGATTQIRTIDFTDSTTGIAMSFRGHILKSTNSGDNWYFSDTLTGYYTPKMKFTDENTGYILSNYIYKTTNRGVTWDTLSTGLLTTALLNGIEFLNDSIGVIVGEDGTIARTTTGGEPVNIQPITAEIPTGFTLYQNYPNPFNPVTKIKFALPKTSDVKVVIYDILGRKVSSLINQRLPSGTYETQWDGSGFASGLYFYSLESEGFKETRKMLLIK